MLVHKQRANGEISGGSDAFDNGVCNDMANQESRQKFKSRDRLVLRAQCDKEKLLHSFPLI